MHLYASRHSLASDQFEAVELASKGSVARVLAAFNLGVASATGGELARAESAFTRALIAVASVAPHDKERVSDNLSWLSWRSRLNLANSSVHIAIDRSYNWVPQTVRATYFTAWPRQSAAGFFSWKLFAPVKRLGQER